MKVRKWLAALAVLPVLALMTAACGDQGGDVSGEDYLPSVTPALDIAITDRLTAAEVTAIIGVEMTASDPYEDGTWVIYTSADGMRSVSVNMENKTEALYDDMIAGLSGGEPVAEMGDKAYWYAQVGELVYYCEGYAIGVSVTDPTVSNTQGLCRAVAEKLAANLRQ